MCCLPFLVIFAIFAGGFVVGVGLTGLAVYGYSQILTGLGPGPQKEKQP